MRIWRLLATALYGVFLGLSGALSAAENREMGDLRNLRVGVPVESLPVEGFTRWRCGSPELPDGQEIEGWQGFADCPANPDGYHEVRFEFEQPESPWSSVSERSASSKIAGHPVNLSMLVDEVAMVAALRIVTDPNTRPHLRMKAFLLGLRMMGRYGRDGWACKKHPRSGAYTAIGGLYINETCNKSLPDRELTVTTRLHRAGAQSTPEYTNSTRLEIRWVGEGR